MIALMNEKKALNPVAWVFILSSAFFVVFILISGGVYLSQGGGGEKANLRSGILGKANSVGVVDLTGVIIDPRKALRNLEKFEKDSRVGAVVIRLNSPGGAVAPSQEIYQAVKTYKKPVVASMGSVAASGAYYVACGAKKIFANAGTITGSIGVIMEFVNLEKLYDWAKVQRYSLKTGKYKDTGADYKAMEPEGRELLQGMIDDVLVQFKEAVSVGRKIPLKQLDGIADGRVFSGTQAKKLGLVDEVGTFRDAVIEAAKMANISGGPHVIYPVKAHSKWYEVLLDEPGDDDGDAAESTAESGLAVILRRVLGVAAQPLAALQMEPGIYWLWRPGR